MSPTNGGAWTLWQTLTPSSGTPNTASATFTGTSNTVYAFYSRRHRQRRQYPGLQADGRGQHRPAQPEHPGDPGGFVQHV